MDLNARVDVNCGWKDGQMENRTPISHLARAGATKMKRSSQVVRVAWLWCRKSRKVVSSRLGFAMRRLETLPVNPAVNGYLYRIKDG